MKTASDPRHQERQKTIQELFAWDAHQKSPGSTKVPLSPKTQSIIASIQEIDSLVTTCAPEWDIAHINQIDLAILRLGIFELVTEPVAPAKVILDEMVELGKEFGTETSPSFINGALGKALVLPQRIKKLISVKLGTPYDKVTDDANLRTDLNASDLEIADLLTTLEKDYNITFEKEPVPQTVGDLIIQIDECLT